MTYLEILFPWNTSMTYLELLFPCLKKQNKTNTPHNSIPKIGVHVLLLIQKEKKKKMVLCGSPE